MERKPQKNDNPKPPDGWFMAGGQPQHYEAGIDNSTFHSGTRCAYMTHAVDKPQQFGTLMQEFSPANYLGKRLKMSAWLKTADAKSWASLWMSVYGQGGRANVSFDNMCKRKILGTTDWTKYEIVLDVPNEATKVAFGAILGGKGRIWIDDIAFEIVSNDVPVTDCPCSERKGLTAFPRNLNFQED